MPRCDRAKCKETSQTSSAFHSQPLCNSPELLPGLLCPFDPLLAANGDGGVDFSIST